jgi:hypothetical protein
VVDDLGFVALADVSRAIGDEPGVPYCVIGGHMVTALVARWGLGAELYRVTADADLGVPPVLVQDAGLIERLIGQGYRRRAGNRFFRIVDDIPVELTGAIQPDREAIIDILVPAYTRRPRQNLKFGEHLVTTEVPGVAFALNRGPIQMSLELHRLNGQRLDIMLAFPDEVGALVLKSLATGVRSRPTDTVDIWRCLEVAFVAGLGPGAFREGIPAESAAVVRSMFARRDGHGMTTLAGQQGLSDPGADERFTRLRALIARVLGSA